MSDYNVKYINTDIKKTIFSDLNSSLASTHTHKFAAHERIFRLIINLSTLSLTAWVALASWKFEAFSQLKIDVYISCGLFVLALLFTVIGDLCIMLQSRTEEGIYLDQKESGITIFNHLNKELVKLINSGITDDQFLQDHSQDIIETHYEILYKRQESETRKAISYSQYNWWFGIAGVLLFFIAIAYSVYTMTNFVGKSENIIKSSEIKKISLIPFKLDSPSPLINSN